MTKHLEAKSKKNRSLEYIHSGCRSPGYPISSFEPLQCILAAKDCAVHMVAVCLHNFFGMDAVQLCLALVGAAAVGALFR